MSFLGTFLALLWDQLSSLHRPSQFDRLYGRYAAWLLPRFNAGTSKHAYLAWVVAAFVPAGLFGLAGLLLGKVYIVGLAWSALVLYQCMGLKQVFDQSAVIGEASNSGDESRIRTCLDDLNPIQEFATGEALHRLAVKNVFELGLRRGFGVIFWFVLAGPGGAVLYAMTVALAGHWRYTENFRFVAAQITAWLDWLPVRLLALSFALVGNFEETLLRWRGSEGEAAQDDLIMLTNVGCGALGIAEPASAQGAAQAAAVLLKRAAVLWLAVLGLLWLGML